MKNEQCAKLFQSFDLTAYNAAEAEFQKIDRKYKPHEQAIAEARAMQEDRGAIWNKFVASPSVSAIQKIVQADGVDKIYARVLHDLTQHVYALKDSEYNEHRDITRAAIVDIREQLVRKEREITLADQARSEREGYNSISSGAFEQIRQALRGIDDNAKLTVHSHPHNAFGTLKSVLTHQPKVHVEETAEAFETSARA